MLKFNGTVVEVSKIVKLLHATRCYTASEEPPLVKKRNIDLESDANNVIDYTPQFNTVMLSREDKRIIADGDWLTDLHVNATQKL